jgi:hypothetical protein
MDPTHEICGHVTRRSGAPSNFCTATSFTMPCWHTFITYNFTGTFFFNHRHTFDFARCFVVVEALAALHGEQVRICLNFNFVFSADLFDHRTFLKS